MTRNVKAYRQLRGIRRVWSVTFDNHTRKFIGWLSGIYRVYTFVYSHYREKKKQSQKSTDARRNNLEMLYYDKHYRNLFSR